MDLKKYVIIVAGGSGTRMGGDIPKQFMLLNGEPVLMHTLRCFYNYNADIKIIVALPGSEIERWEQLCREHSFTIEHRIVAGGFTRFHSVKNALELVSEKSLVAVHDGVRPLVSPKTIETCFNSAEHTGAAIPVTECYESIRRLEDDRSITVDRNLYRMVQTPQVFDSEILLNAYKQPYLTLYTDDASVVEHNGHTISLVDGNRENIKITISYDLFIAEILLNK
ncbi:MAG: 2-C-methyl-D-erythritol 4-phosphate cytidylyltransferase [Prevotellaceae bacterium]|jgi:2-C-methyl-D-erythritol 4-phosphate cytidylyltransferase|nr:2-C-methyl-D-erythritol 4-phosphate cytidylyltransferase [Prevotellaceae bacterium]